jgi:hypothetical protein
VGDRSCGDTSSDSRSVEECPGFDQLWQRSIEFGQSPVNPYFVRADNATVEVWSGQRIQHGNEGRDNWQRALKAELRRDFSRLDIPSDALLAGHYNTTSPIVTDTENSLFTNMAETMPRAFTALRFERGAGIPPEPPIPIDLTSGHLHYYRYQVGGLWTTWKPDQTLARWARVPRRLPGDDTARPVWFALRQSERRRARIRLKRRCPRAGYQLWGAHHRARHETPLA